MLLALDDVELELLTMVEGFEKPTQNFRVQHQNHHLHFR